MGVTILRDLSVLWSLSHILLLFMLLYRSRYPKKTTTILTVVFMGSLALLNTAGLVKYGTELMGQVFLLTCTLPSLFFFWFMSQDKKGQFFFTFCLADTVSYWINRQNQRIAPGRGSACESKAGGPVHTPLYLRLYRSAEGLYAGIRQYHCFLQMVSQVLWTGPGQPTCRLCFVWL